ncbi:hypothetical protein BC828DRAFT_106238 [Blastocladiella britannica]|nr:hypothetical protein BC828DRAFT_106238 [Blastocladiella britannica]
MATDTRIIAVFHVTSEAVGPMIVSLYKSGWLTSAPRVLLSLNDLAVAICDYTPTLCPEILASVPIAFLSELTEDAAVFDAFSAQYTLQTGLQYGCSYYCLAVLKFMIQTCGLFRYSAQGGVDFGRGYGCGFALVAGLHNLVQTVGNGDLSILSPINATYFKSMTLDMFNLTASVPGVRQPYMINANGDPIYSKYTITGARAIPSQNTSLPPLVKSTLNYILNAADGSVTAAMSSPTLWIGGKVPLDSPIRTSANVQWGGPGGIALICMAASTLLFVLVSAGVFWANRDHPEVRATSLLASMMVNLAALLGITSIGSYIGDPSTIVCHVRFWSSTLAYGTILAACLPKTYRVYKLLYSSVGGSAASQWEMARLAAFIIVCELGGAAVYSFVARPVATLEVLSLTSQQVECLSQSDGFKFGVTPLVTVVRFHISCHFLFLFRSHTL